VALAVAEPRAQPSEPEIFKGTMKAKKFYLNLEHDGVVRQGFGVKLLTNETVLSSTVDLLRNIHVTLHEPQPAMGLMETIAHIRESQQDSVVTLLRVPRPKRLIEVIGMYVDRDQLDNAKEFKKTSYDDQYTLTADFGNYLTFRFFQGPADLISKTMDDLITTKKPGVLIPHSDGFYIDPAGRAGTDKVNFVQIVFDDRINPTIGVLALGVDKAFEVVGNDVPADPSLKLIALAPPDKRYIRR
jgi:hypothetical protein